MKIPKQFKLLGQTIKVKFDEDLNYRQGHMGQAQIDNNILPLQPVEKDRPKDAVEHTFCHELAHFLLYYTLNDEYDQLWRNERVVEVLGGLIHQFLTTARYR